MVTIRDSRAELERSLGDVLRAHLPQIAAYPIEVEIFENDRKKRSDASRESWRPAAGEIRIKFGGPRGATPASTLSSASGRQQGVPEASEDPLQDEGAIGHQQADLIKALERTERRPGFNFVALKRFRDFFLPAEGYPWAKSPSAREDVLRGAIGDGVVLTSKVPNPKTPAFPVTAIRLNRQHPEVIEVLGKNDTADSGFQPVDIRGEGLSTTILHERR